jgi:Pectate lyase superfamily protein
MMPSKLQEFRSELPFKSRLACAARAANLMQAGSCLHEAQPSREFLLGIDARRSGRHNAVPPLFSRAVSFLAWILLCLMSIDSYSQRTPTPPAGAGAASQVGASPISTAPPVHPQVMQAPLAAPSFEGSVNRTLLVTAPPFNAKCDGVTDDNAGIQAAFNEALARAESIQFPAGTCLTSTITWKGQPFFGAGTAATIIKGKPGQDVFATPDGNTWTAPNGGTLVHDLKILVDNSVDASAAPQGNNTFPNRIAGTLGGASNFISPAIASGGAAFGTYNGVASGCTAVINSGSLNTLVLTGCPSLTNDRIQTWRTVGAPITVKGVGPSGADLVTTIASIVNSTTLTLTTPATSSGTGLSGTFLNPITAPYYIGNCAFAFPDSDGSHPSPSLSDWTVQNVLITWVNGGLDWNHSCGMFVQAPPYALHLDRVNIQQLWGGYVEAMPALNPLSSTWTGDTSSYKDIDLYLNTIPILIMGGNHRTFSGLNIYASGPEYQNFGALWLAHGSSATITRFYHECGYSIGETERFTGDYGINIQGGSLDQCTPNHYVGWNASKSTVDAGIISMQIAPGANQNAFTHAVMASSFLSDKGLDNSVETNGNTNSVSNPRAFFANRPQNPVGRLDSGWLLSGNSATPFTSGNDLLMTCSDFNFATRYNSSTKQYDVYCVPDPKGTEITQSYFHATPAAFSGGWNLGPGPQGIGPNGKLLIVGDRLPRAPMTFVVLARCDQTCTQHYTISDRRSAHGIAGADLSFGSNWTIRSFPVDLSSVPEGDQITVAAGTPWGGGANTMDTASWAFEPVNVDTIKAAVAATLAALSPRGIPTDQDQPSNSKALGMPLGLKPEYSGTTNPIGGTALSAGQCVAGTAQVREAAIGRAVIATPATYPGDGIAWRPYVSGPGVVTVKVCAEVARTPATTSYNVRVIP